MSETSEINFLSSSTKIPDVMCINDTARCLKISDLKSTIGGPMMLLDCLPI